MATKEEALKMLKDSYESEDVIIIDYKDYVHKLTDESDLPDESKKKIKEYMTILVAQSYNHARIFNEWRAKISGSDEDEF